MKVTPIKHDYIEMMSKAVETTRAKGIHMSDIYGALYERLEPKRYKKAGPFKSSMYSEMGVILERTLEDGFRKRLVDAVSERPDEQSIQEPWMLLPVYYNPDLLIFEGKHEERIGEIKLTWMSSSEVPRTKGTNGFPSKFDKYFTQMKLYGYARETPYARLIAGFVNGRWDFKDRENGFRPELLAWDIEFTMRELKEEWDTCMGFARSEKLFEKFDKMMNRRKM
jgi:hypothetical protein